MPSNLLFSVQALHLSCQTQTVSARVCSGNFFMPHRGEVLSENDLSLNSRVDGQFPAILKRLISFHPTAECTACAKDTFQSRARQLIEERRV